MLDVSRLEELYLEYHTRHRRRGQSTLAETLDAAYAVYAEAEALRNGVEQPTEKQRRLIDRMSALFLRICCGILNVTTGHQVTQAMQDRQARRAFRPGYIPGQTETVRTTYIDPNTAQTKGQYQWRRVAAAALLHKHEMIGVVNEESRRRDQGLVEHSEITRMFSDVERDSLRVFVNGGILVRFNRALMKNVPLDTVVMESHGKLGFAAFVLTIDGELFVFNHLDKSDQVAHSSPTRGGPVIGAGELSVRAGGLRIVTAYSGHYRPGLTQVGNVLRWFQSKGVDLSNALVNFQTDPGLSIAGKQPVEITQKLIPSEERVRDLYDVRDIDRKDVLAYMGITRFTYRAIDVLDPFG